MHQGHSKIDDELRSIRDTLLMKESEETWDAIANALDRFKDVVRRYSEGFPLEVSERSRLSGTAIDLLALSATELADSFHPLLPLFVPALLSLCTRTNKVFLTRGRACLNTIISSTQSPAVLPFLVQKVKDKSVALRATVAEAALTCLNSVNPPDLEKEIRARDVETLIKVTATDSSADIRRLGRQLFDAYKLLLPHRVESFTAPLTPTIRKYLDIRGTLRASSQSTSRPQSAMSIHSSSSSRNTKKVPELEIPDSLPTANVAGSSRSQLRSCGTRNYNRPRSAQELGHVDQQLDTALHFKVPEPTLIPLESPNPDVMIERIHHSARTLATSSMPPPEFVPQRRLLHSTAMPKAGSALDGASNTQRSRPGPLRPGTLTASILPAENEGAQRSTGGARRVLRSEPPTVVELKSAVVKKPLRPDMRGALSTSEDIIGAATGDSERSGRAAPGLPSSVSSRDVTDAETCKPTSSPARVDKPTTRGEKAASLGRDPHASSRVTKPTMSQMTRMKSNLASHQRPTGPSHKQARELSTKSTKGRAKPSAPKVRQPTVAQVNVPVSEAADAMVSICPSSIPLPASPTQHQSDDTDIPARQCDEDSPDLPPEGSRSPTPHCLPSTPATPVTMTHSIRLSAMQQTPISALVESIRSEFGFAHESPSMDIWGTDESNVLNQGAFNVAPLSWGHKEPNELGG